MIKYLFAAAALVVAGAPAAFGLASNASFTRDVPVRVPQQAQTATPSPASTASIAGDDGTADRGHGGVEPGDDHGGDVPRALRTEPGDDHGHGAHHAEPGDDHGGDHGDDPSHSGSGGGSDDDSGHH